MSTYRTKFTPGDHGFGWLNEFRGEDIVASWFDQGLVTNESVGYMLGVIHGGPPGQLTAGMLDITEDEMVEELADLLDGGGMSAGMCLVALDRYHEGASPWKRKPGKKSKNFARLAQSHFEVFGRWSGLVGLISDMNRPDVAHAWNHARSLGDLSTGEWWPRIRRQLASGNPAPIMLYRSRWNPFANHVVVVTGGRERSGGRQIRLGLYDPNHPGVNAHLNVDLDRKGAFRLGPQALYGPGWRRVRGFKRISRQTGSHHDQLGGELALLAAI